MIKSADAFRTISEVAEDLDLPQHVLRFWETRFPQIRPLKRAGGRRFYRPSDVALLTAIRQLLYGEGYTIKGVQRLLKEQGTKAIQTGQGASAGPVLQGAVDTQDDDADAIGDADHADDMPATLRSALDNLPLDAGPTRLLLEDRDELKAALATITECERILRATRRPPP
ncbi:MerR family transcriptional regulator [Beijerinckia sp. L45]|uniref:MerR family transcriptional regulator n=1 Tax=Beijerinckia sp. L45 TaxID=1641855 RepID=UPI00131E88B8|nr:MerR family transcriptional regulator [Beijerinckia sp. L45]